MKKYLIELLVIFVGISASFLVDEYREDIEIGRQVRKSLHSLKTELNSDVKDLKTLIANIDSTDEHFSYILNFNAKSLVDKAVKKLKEEKIKYSLNLTINSGDEIDLVKRATKNGYNKILAIGGDGTVQKVVAGIVMQQSISLKKMVFALIPSGTGNDWAKSKNISSKLNECVETLKGGKIKTQDVGVATIKSANEKKTRYFITYSGVGFDSFMLSKIDKYKWLGKLSYLVCAIMNFLKFQNIAVRILTSKTEINTNVFLLGIGICKYTGGGTIP